MMSGSGVPKAREGGYTSNPYVKKADWGEEICMICEGRVFVGEEYWEFSSHTGFQSDNLVVCRRCKDMMKFCRDCGEPYMPVEGDFDVCEECEDLYTSVGGAGHSRAEIKEPARQAQFPKVSDTSVYTKEPGHPPNEYVEFRKGNIIKRVWVGPHPSDQVVSEGLREAATIEPPVEIRRAEAAVPGIPEVITGEANMASVDSGDVEIVTGDNQGAPKVKKQKKVKENGNGKSKKTYSSDLSKFRVKECGYCGEKDKDKPVVSIAIDVWSKAIKLMRAVETEWLGYLMGRKLNNGNYEITEIIIPTQEVEYASCENKETPPPDAIGIIHSHHNMFASHSGIDDDGIDQQNTISIVVSTKGCSVTVKRDLPCGMFIVLEADYEVMLPDSEVADWIAQSRGKMNRKNYQSGPNSQYQAGYCQRLDGYQGE